MTREDIGSIYRVYAKIDLDALDHNVKEILRCKDENAFAMGVIKANAYGHGAIHVAKELESLGIHWFAVATVDEGIQLRNAGIQGSIMILGHSDESQFEDMIKWSITPTIYAYESAVKFNTYAKAHGIISNVHVKIDTGMSRIGFLPNSTSIEVIEAIDALENIHIQGLFTHFACADTKDKSHVEIQIKKFRWMIEQLHKCNIHPEIIHCSNSASIMELPEEHMNMVRAGIILYGLYPSDEVDYKKIDLKPVMSLHSHVVHLKEVTEGVTIGYGATYTVHGKMKIATIPVGYADGYFRSLSNKARVLIHDQYAPVVGRVCMDQLMVDVTHIPETCLGDEVVLFGKDNTQSISVEEVADLASSFNYEFVCGISQRVPRVYTRNGNVVEIVNYLR